MTDKENLRSAEPQHGGVIVETIPAEDVADETRTKVFPPGQQAIAVRSAHDPGGPVLYFTEAQWDAFIAAIKGQEKNQELDAILAESHYQTEQAIIAGLDLEAELHAVLELAARQPNTDVPADETDLAISDSASQSGAARTALVIDLESLLQEQGRRVSYQLASQRLEEIFDLVGPVEHTFVVASPWALRDHIAQFADRQVPVAVASRGPDSADQLLLARLSLLEAQGYDRFFIASNDSIFAPFAGTHNTTIITTNLRSVPGSLRRDATAIIALRVG